MTTATNDSGVPGAPDNEHPPSQSFELAEGYERLADVLRRAYRQAAFGKGRERHANDLPFHCQPMQVISKLIGSEAGMAFQAIKKINEALRLPTPERQVAELLGAINYIAGVVIYIEEQAGLKK